MKIPSLFKEYIWLIETINRAGKISFAEINKRWVRKEESGGVEFSRSTFNRHKDAILDMFGVIIECERKGGYNYFIENKEVLEEDSVQNWLYSTLSVSNMLDENMALQHRILLESIPSGDQHLQQIIKAMRENRRMMMTYQRYGTTSANTYSVAPYCVKLFRRRWYMLGTRPKTSIIDGKETTTEGYAIYSLDRIENIELEETRFTLKPNFDAAAFFNECFGVVVGDGSKPERIVLRAYGLEQHYMRDLPLHHTQREINKTEEYTDYELYLRPTSDFKAHLMSRGEWIQVLSPEWLANDIQQLLQAAIDRYKMPEKQKQQ